MINIEFLCSSMKDTELFDDSQFFIMPTEDVPAAPPAQPPPANQIANLSVPPTPSKERHTQEFLFLVVELRKTLFFILKLTKKIWTLNKE